MENGLVLVTTRVTVEANQRAQKAADKYFEGNRTMLVRSAINTYVDLREALGPRFELAVAEMKGEIEKEGRAA